MPDVVINALDGASFEAYQASPVGENGPGLIVIHEMFGLTAEMRRLCDFFAGHGYIALCPNLFWRQGATSADQNSLNDVWDLAGRYYKNFDIEAGIRDLLATLAYARLLPGCGGKVGAVGYGLGGRLAFLMASRSDIDCAVGYYGTGIETSLDEIYDIRQPLLLHFGEQDKLIPAPTLKKIQRSIARNKVIEADSYPAADHGFARLDGEKYNKEATARAEQRTLSFLSAHLQK